MYFGKVSENGSDTFCEVTILRYMYSLYSLCLLFSNDLSETPFTHTTVCDDVDLYLLNTGCPKKDCTLFYFFF
jgi:hypothetical protein